MAAASLEHWYAVNKRQGTLPERYRGMTHMELYDDLGCSVRPYDAFNPAILIEDSEEITVETREEGPLTTRIEHTPVGDLVRIEECTDMTHHTRKYPVVTPDDMRVMEWKLRHQKVGFDMDRYQAGCELIGERGAPAIFIPRINLMRIVIDFMGFENGLTAFMEYPAETEALVHAINETGDALLDMVAACPIEIVNFGDNVHQVICPPSLFRQWVQPEYLRRNERLHAAGKKAYPH